MLQYKDTINQGLSERSQPKDDWESFEETDGLMREKFISSPTSYSKNWYSDLFYSSDKFAKCDGTGPKSGGFYVPNAASGIIKSEEFLDLNQLLFSNIDESSAPASKIEDDVDLNKYFDHRKGADNNQIIYNKSKNTSSSSNCKNEYTKHSNVKSGCQSTCTSISQSPTNVSMDSSSNQEYYLLNATDISAENTTIDGSYFTDPIYETLCDDKLFYTPDNSCGLIDFTDGQRRNHPTLTLNLKGTFVNEDEINTPNIINTIMEASDEPLQFVRSKEDLFSEVPFFPTSPPESYPSTSSPTTVADISTVDLSAVTFQEPVSPVKKPGRPRKRRRHYDSDEEGFDNEDDDETYIPPVRVRRKSKESRSIGKKKIIYENISEDEEDCESLVGMDVESVEHRLKPISVFEDEFLRVGKRGRPPKHARSISSDDYSLLDPEDAKYREMRDRNNEASRKSRYKRKQKEIKVADELDDLETENIKLKTQVDELQKTVERYRDNLMKVMMGKK